MTAQGGLLKLAIGASILLAWWMGAFASIAQLIGDAIQSGAPSAADKAAVKAQFAAPPLTHGGR
jgi:hypothetical protein